MQVRFFGKGSFLKVLTLTAIAMGLSLSSLSLAAQSNPRGNYPPDDQQAQAQPQEQPAVPQELTLQPGTVVSVRINDWLSSDQNQPGDDFSAVLEQPLVADGWVVAYAGQPVTGRVVVAQRAGRTKGTSQLGVELSELTLADGQVVPVMTQLVRSSAGTSRERDAATVAGTTGAGAAIGAAVGGGKGAGIGAGIGAAVGVIGVLATPGRETVIPAEAQLTFRVEAPVVFSTERGGNAFQPVTADTYRSQDREPAYPDRRYVPPPRRYYSPRVFYPSYRGPYYYPLYAYPYSYGYDYYYYRPYSYRYYYPGTSFVFRFGGSHGYRHYGGHHHRH